MNAVTPTPTNFANRMVTMALTQYSWASSHSPTSLSGNSGITGTANTISVLAGDSVSTRSDSHCLNMREREPRNDAHHDRLEMIPQPCFDQEDDREQDPDRL